MGQQKKSFEDYEFWGDEFDGPEPLQIFTGSENPTIMGLLTGILTMARNHNEMHRYGSGSKLEPNKLDYYFASLENLVGANMSEVKGERGKAMASLDLIKRHLIATMECYPDTTLCDCTLRARDAAAMGDHISASHIRFTCVDQKHHFGWWNSHKALDSFSKDKGGELTAGFGSRISPMWVVQTMARLMNASRWENQHGWGYKTEDGFDVPTLKEIEELLKVDEANYRPKEDKETGKRRSDNRRYDRTDNNPVEDQSMADRSWRHHDNYERAAPMDKNGAMMLEAYPPLAQVVKALWIPQSEYDRWDHSKYHKWFNSHWKTSEGATVNTSRLEKIIEIPSDPTMVKNQPMVEAWDLPEYEFDSKPMIEVVGVSNIYGVFERIGWSNVWSSGSFTLNDDSFKSKRRQAIQEILHYFMYGYVRWSGQKLMKIPGNRVWFDLERNVTRDLGSRWVMADIKRLGIKLKVQKRYCWLCKDNTWHARDQIKDLERGLTYQCNRHLQQQDNINSGFYGTSHQIKCICCGVVAKTMTIPMVVSLGIWEFKVDLYGRFAEEVMNLLESQEWLCGFLSGPHDTPVSPVRYNRYTGTYTRIPTLLEQLLKLKQPISYVSEAI